MDDDISYSGRRRTELIECRIRALYDGVWGIMAGHFNGSSSIPQFSHFRRGGGYRYTVNQLSRIGIMESLASVHIFNHL
jgi:hypothetical protein